MTPGSEAAAGERPAACAAYREAMRLLGLQRRLAEAGLSDEERRRLREEIARLEIRVGLA